MADLTFREAAELFSVYCKSKGLAPRTLETYLSALGGLHGFLSQAAGDQSLPQTAQLRAYIAHMLDKGLSRQTIRVRMRSVRCFCNFLEREGLVPSSPMRGVEIPKVPNEYPAVLSAEQARRLLRACKTKSWYGVRDYALVATFLDAGLRVGEAVRLDVDDVNLQDLLIQVRRGKGNKDRLVFVGRVLFHALRRWVEARGVTTSDRAFFVTRQGDRMSIRDAERVVDKAAARAGLEGIRLSPHVLRHTFATLYVQNGGDPFSLQRILGHSDIKTTMIYVNLAGVGLREAHAKASPVDRLLAR